jgi:hypothetical protein
MRSPRIAVAAALTFGAILSGCSSGSGSSSSTAQTPAAPAAAASDTAESMPGMSMPAAAPAAAAAAPAPDYRAMKAATKAAPAAASAAAAPAAAADSSGSSSPTHATADLGIPDTALAGRSISYTAEETVKVEDVGKAVSSIEASVAGAGGLVANSERTGSGDEATANMVLKVPPGGFNSFLDRIGKLGEVVDRTLSGNDVTEQVVDVAGRVDSQRKSVDRVRALMTQAKSLRDVVTLEGELSSREADLESLLARQQKLAQQVDLATVTLHVQTRDKPEPPPAPKHSEPTGFVAGLNNGWGAFTGALVAAATVAGAVLPFALLVVVLVPVLVLALRRVRRHRPEPS